jgi:flavodoxin
MVGIALLCSALGIANAAAEPKVLVVYFSMQGHTRTVAEEIARQTGATIAEIRTEENYARADIEEVVKKQNATGYLPRIASKIPDISGYDLVFVGSPVWWYTLSPPVRAWLAATDFRGKKVVPFCTCKSAEGTIFRDFAAQCRNGTVLEGLNVYDRDLAERKKANRAIAEWIKRIRAP